jgi:hypothetical protein
MKIDNVELYILLFAGTLIVKHQKLQSRKDNSRITHLICRRQEFIMHWHFTFQKDVCCP